ncbi:hypothetical protein [Prochlorococcus sp. MIT 0916]
MQKPKSQQFAKFFIKDLKSKAPKYQDEKSDLEKLISSSVS